MASQVEICNLALARIGQRPIASLAESSTEAAACTTFYDRDRRAVLRAHPWNFALTVAALAESTSDAEYGYTYRYVLPTDCLRPLELTNLAQTGSTSESSDDDDEGTKVAFKIMGRDLLTNMENARLGYICNEEDPNMFDDMFIEALSYRLGADLAGTLPESGAFQKNMIQLFQETLANAKGVDAAVAMSDSTQTIISVRA